MSTSAESFEPVLCGVDHTARPTWKLRQTIEFYRDVLGLKLIHAITAKGWGRENHADFLHFFFDSGRGSTIAFFYYIGTEQPDYMVVPKGYIAMANHTAWRVESEAELLAWRDRLKAHGVQVSEAVRHEIIESIYFRDPNWYPLEITRAIRPKGDLDAIDAELTLEAAMRLEDQGGWTSIEPMWQRKADLVLARSASGLAAER